MAKEIGALTVAVVTRPFVFEGAQRKTIADDAYDQMEECVDTMITIPNDRILQIVDRKTSLLMPSKSLTTCSARVSKVFAELITVPGLINVDFA